MTTRPHEYTAEDIGCYFDGARGVYIGEAVQEMAGRHGLENSVVITEVPCHHDGLHGDGFDTGLACPCPGEDEHDDWYDGATDEAVDYLNTLTSEDVVFTFHEGEFFLMPIDDDVWA